MRRVRTGAARDIGSGDTAGIDPDQSSSRPRGVKLAHVTALFWVIKTIATTLGETAGDMVSQTFQLGNLLATIVLMGLFVIAVTFQLHVSMRDRLPYRQ